MKDPHGQFYSFHQGHLTIADYANQLNTRWENMKETSWSHRQDDSEYKNSSILVCTFMRNLEREDIKENPESSGLSSAVYCPV